MPNQVEDFMSLVKAGKIKEAKAWIEAEKVKAKYSPDTVVSEDGMRWSRLFGQFLLFP